MVETISGESIRIVFFDIDGTLLPEGEREIPGETLRALHSLRERGVKVCLASGRYPAATDLVARFFPFDGVVCCNGQYCYVSDGTVLRKVSFTAEQVWSVYEYFRELPVPCFFASEDRICVTYMPEEMRARRLAAGWLLPDDLRPDWLREAEILQMVVHDVAENDEKLEAAFPFLRAARAVPSSADVMPRHGGKERGIDALCAHFGLTTGQAAAFGDGYNDVEMLAHCALGVAMGNAPEAVRRCAHMVTAHAGEGGIPLALAKLGLI